MKFTINRKHNFFKIIEKWNKLYSKKNVVINSDGIVLYGMSDNNVMMSVMRFNPDNFSVVGKDSFVIDLDMFVKCFKLMKGDIELVYDDKSLVFSSGNKKNMMRVQEYENDLKTPDIDYTFSAEFTTKELQEVFIKQESHCYIHTKDNRLHIKQESNQETFVSEDSLQIDTDIEVSAKYDMTYLSMMINNIVLSTAKLSMGTNLPLQLNYGDANIVVMELLAPRGEE